ncbi:MAG: hypothetical protein FJZ01_15325 [Candidatus Sericytochromatia bacterium]|nr:hypothetical protein [Candidatus Tanganyikabacteria bacterium]
MDPTGKGAGSRRSRHAAQAALAVAGIHLLAGCNFVLPGAIKRPTTQLPVGQGAVRHFPLRAGDVSLPFPASKNLVLMVSASGSASTAFSFRVQNSEAPAGEARFTSDAARWRAPAYAPGAAPRRRTQANLPLGTKLDFWINTGDSSAAGDCLRRASLEYLSPHAYFFVDVGPGGSGSRDAVCGGPAGPELSKELLRGMAAAFEGESPLAGALPIYQTVTGMFGPDPVDGGVDGDPRTFVVISPAVDKFGQEKGLMGYYWSRDVQPRTTSPADPRSHSNEREAIFLTNQIFNQKPYTTYGTLAHEFTHLVMYYQRSMAGSVAEEVWWDEALSMLAMDRTGYGLRAGNVDIAKDIGCFLERPSAYSMTQWSGNPHNFAYGLVYVFARYLHERFGQQLIREVIAIPDGGVAGLDRALRRRNTSFQQVYSDFVVAVYTSGTQLEVDPQYRMPAEINLRASYGGPPDPRCGSFSLCELKDPRCPASLDGVQAQRLQSFGQLQTVSLRTWGTAYYELGQGDPYPWTFAFKIPEALFGSAIGW